MRIVVIPDAHLDQINLDDAVEWIKGLPNGDMYLVLGDLSNANQFNFFMSKFPKGKTWFVLGNHDFYNGSISRLRHDADNLLDQKHLSTNPILSLPQKPDVAIIGTGGWGDMLFSNDDPLRLADFDMIQDYSGSDHVRNRKVAQHEGEREARILSSQLDQIDKGTVKHVLIFTHVPLFPESCQHGGYPSEPAAIQVFCHTKGGKVVHRFSRQNPSIRITAISGHTHTESLYVNGSITSVVMGAEYGKPSFRIVSI